MRCSKRDCYSISSSARASKMRMADRSTLRRYSIGGDDDVIE
jgi:hypothetical protein